MRRLPVTASLLFVLALSASPAWAQDVPPTASRSMRTGGPSSELPLSGGIDPTVRDYILYIINERSKASDQRFDAQQVANVVAFQAQEKAQGLALQSIKELTAAAFAAAKEAVTKQETSFDKQLNQGKAETDIRFKSVDEKLAIVMAQMNTGAGRDAGTQAMWTVIGIVVGLLITGLPLAFTLVRHQPAPPLPPNYSPSYGWPPPFQPPNGNGKSQA